MAQKTIQDYIREYITPGLITIFGWYMSTTITEVKTDVKALLETRATHTEQLRTIESRMDKVERKVFGFSLIAVSFYKVLNIVYEKPRQLEYRNGSFDYV